MIRELLRDVALKLTCLTCLGDKFMKCEFILGNGLMSASAFIFASIMGVMRSKGGKRVRG